MTDYYPVRVGQGKEIHAATVHGIFKKGRIEHTLYNPPICGTGNYHYYNTARLPLTIKKAIGEITCEKCLAMLAQKEVK